MHGPDDLSIIKYNNYLRCTWVRSPKYDCLVTWFCYQLIAKPGNNTAFFRDLTHIMYHDAYTITYALHIVFLRILQSLMDFCEHCRLCYQSPMEFCEHCIYLYSSVLLCFADHHGISSGWSSVWHHSNNGLSSTQYEQIPIILGVWLTPFFFSVNDILAGLWLNCISSVEITLNLLADILLQFWALFQC